MDVRVFYVGHLRVLVYNKTMLCRFYWRSCSLDTLEFHFDTCGSPHLNYMVYDNLYNLSQLGSFAVMKSTSFELSCRKRRKSSIKPPLYLAPSLISSSPLSQNCHISPPLYWPPTYIWNSRIYQIFLIYLAKEACMLILIWLGRKTVSNICIWPEKLYADAAKYGVKTTEKLPNMSVSFDFVNKPPSNKSPFEASKIKRYPWHVGNNIGLWGSSLWKV